MLIQGCRKMFLPGGQHGLLWHTGGGCGNVPPPAQLQSVKAKFVKPKIDGTIQYFEQYWFKERHAWFSQNQSHNITPHAHAWCTCSSLLCMGWPSFHITLRTEVSQKPRGQLPTPLLFFLLRLGKNWALHKHRGHSYMHWVIYPFVFSCSTLRSPIASLCSLSTLTHYYHVPGNCRCGRSVPVWWFLVFTSRGIILLSLMSDSQRGVHGNPATLQEECQPKRVLLLIARW